MDSKSSMASECLSTSEVIPVNTCTCMQSREDIVCDFLRKVLKTLLDKEMLISNRKQT